MFLLRFVLMVLVLKLSFTASSTLLLDPDEVRNIDELVESRGFVLKKYYALTDDGYLLTVHRLVTRDFDPTIYNRQRKPVIAFHGVMGDASVFLINSPFLHSNGSFCGDNFGFCGVLSGKYDVWLPNARGTRFSREHVRYTDKDSRFWKFSLDEIALYDIPAIVDLVRLVTGWNTIGYVGFSQGAATMIELLSYRPEYGQVIRPFIAWAPAVFVSNAKTVIAPSLIRAGQILSKFPGEFLPGASFNNPLQQYALCRGVVRTALCGLMLQAIYGPSKSLNHTRLPVYYHHSPSSVSNWQVAHFGQLCRSGRFQRFDYGNTNKNRQKYGKPVPPKIPLWRVPKTVPIVVMHGRTDWFVDSADAHKLISTLRRLGIHTVIDHHVNAQVWSHADFTIGIGAGRLVYEKTLKYLDIFE